ncbi:hypothetical protein GOP47_0016167 [Adiantum capillus-veneris]|uniref:Pentatricopeptide repeat-containing protein n=1 Tax=Adiantum capillus-veneris TaxID=13818 RepID=A0A9D4ZEN0_ADICA|nr:hypothetical protein GOP47_0016167 [Adiantum capillus-veneris]
MLLRTSLSTLANSEHNEKPPTMTECPRSLANKNLRQTADLHVRGLDKVQYEFYDRAALISFIKSCGKHKDLHKGSTVHADVLERGLLKNDIALSNALLSMYTKCGALSKAQEMFDELPARTIVSWNALITGYVRQGFGNRALACFEQMLDQGLSPNAVTYLCILKACGTIQAVDKGEEIHAELGRQGLLEKDLVLGTAVVDMYAKCGALTKAQAVFDQFQAQDPVMWNALLSGYVQNGFGHKALRCYKQMQDQGIHPDSVTFISVLKACGSTGAVDKGAEIHAELRKQGLLGRNIMLGTALVDMYSKCGAFAEALLVFDELPAPNVVTWNALITGYVQQGLCNEALQCLKRMKDHGLAPDNVTFICILTACGGLGAVEKGEEIHLEVEKQDLLRKDIVLGNALVDMYAKCGALENAREVLDKLQGRGVATWTALIAGYVQHGLDDDALSCYGQMRGEGTYPDDVTFGCILKACGNLGALQKGTEIHAEVGQQDKDSVLGTAVVDMYAKCGLLVMAQQVFDRLLVWNVAAWTALITGYAQAGQVEMVYNSFIHMTGQGIEPNVVTYVVLLTACSHAGLVDEGQMYFESMRAAYHIDPTLEHHVCMVDIFTRAGQFDQAVCVIDMVPSTDRLLLWSVMMGACRKWADVELGRLAFERALQLDQKFPTAFVCLSHLYAAAGMQD